jgi:opacity protein-like surface antigen
VSRLTAAAAAAIFATPSLAAGDEGTGRASGVYLRGAGGVVFGETLEQDLSYNPAVVFVTPPATAKATDVGDGLAISAAIGFQYAKTRTELEYRRMEASVDGVAYAGGAAPAVTPVNDELVAQALMSNVYFDFVNKSPFTPYVGVGVGGARIENELGERDAAFAYQGRAGVEVALGGRFAIGAEYVYFRTLDVKYGPKNFTATGPAGPRTDGDPFVSSSVMGTVRAVF